MNRKGWGRAAALWRIFKAFLQARRILKQHRADAVISVGGFSAAPAALAAVSRGTPLFIHEQNAVSGRLNRLLRPFAKRFFSSYDPASPVRDYPVSGEFFKRARVRSSVKTVIFLGGSQGAAFINDLALSVAPRLRERGIGIIHQCGERDFGRVQAAYAERGVEAELYGFTKELPALIERSDLAVSRAGASTLWELCASGIPALYVPYPHAAADHQYHNARFLVEQGLGWCERQGEGVEGLFLTLLDEELETCSRALMELCHPEGAERMVKVIEEQL